MTFAQVIPYWGLRVVLVAAVVLSMSCSATTPESVDWFQPNKAHHTLDENGHVRFVNTHVKDKDKSFFDFMRMRFFGDESWADHAALADTVSSRPVDIGLITTPPTKPTVTWLGHSTFLFQHQGVNILTDPVFSDRASPVSFAGPKRYSPHVIDYRDLPAIDMVVISHNHYDHLDKLAIEMLGPQVHYYVPLGLKPWFVERGVAADNVTQMDWWETRSTNATNLRVQALPSQHWSARGLSDRFSTLWASWAITFDDFTLWFAGDTGYTQAVFEPIGKALGQVDLALIPIGAYAPRWFMQDYHANPEEAVQMHKDVNATLSIGMHWGTFPLTAEPPAEPPLRLKEALQAAQLSSAEFMVLDIGETQVVME
ncbi:MBL fold metallo-hydrolase [Alteromonas oceanisediminis]|uniref:MBL fold metallo-hydrolase n=1 Tax=Alteromonas oceanisediminis TaxID=2836180 RepID=UPI001BD921E8|nr:MBL fold metallo-hydrolase [Alteromonas oceanisediminis]MBT0586738.1 MBL fold metallo-hydrolase [Alteromonas oceanisediminis]